MAASPLLSLSFSLLTKNSSGGKAFLLLKGQGEIFDLVFGLAFST